MNKLVAQQINTYFKRRPGHSQYSLAREDQVLFVNTVDQLIFPSITIPIDRK